MARSGKDAGGDEREKGGLGSAGRKGGEERVELDVTCKEQGEWAELCFITRARQIGLPVLKPYGDSSQYDVGIEHKGRLAREQVKSTTFIRERTFSCNMVGLGGGVCARPGEFLRGLPGAGKFVVYPAVRGGAP